MEFLFLALFAISLLLCVISLLTAVWPPFFCAAWFLFLPVLLSEVPLPSA